jgi:hypothetical protein
MLGNPLDGVSKYVADTPHGLDKRWIALINFQLAPEPKDLDIDAAIEHVLVNASRLQQEFARQWPLRSVIYVSIMPDDPETIVCRDGACIVNPFGELLAGPLWDREGILTAEVDLREIPKVQ